MPKLKNIYKLLDPEIRAKNILALKRVLKGIRWDFSNVEMIDPVFVIGCSRSGTTISFETLSLSSNFISFGFEIPQFWQNLYGPASNGWKSHAAQAGNASEGHRKKAFRHFYQHLGSGRVLDKTCINVLRIEYLYALFPNAQFIFLHRDGRDNINSLMEGWRKTGQFGLKQFLGEFPCKVNINKGEFKEWCFFLPPDWTSYNQASLEEVCALQWVSANESILDARERIPASQWIQINYEDLFHDPVQLFGNIFMHLDLPFEDQVRERCANLHKHQTSIVNGAPRLSKWLTGRNKEAIERILPVIAPTMEKLNYKM